MPTYTILECGTECFPTLHAVICDGKFVEAYETREEAETFANECIQWFANNPE